MANLTFPEGFVWGTASAAHQVEGSNWNSDWWAWEHNPDGPCAEPSGDTCDHLSRYPADMALLAGLGFTSYRFSIEWARIEPEDGLFSKQWLDHYRRMIGTCREQGLLPVVTFHHFTSPRWIAAEGGWENPAVVDRFTRYCEKAAGHLGDLIGMACTINEPNIVAFYGYRVGVFPPGVATREARDRADENFIAAHRKSYDPIKAAVGDAPVGLALSMADYQAVEGGEAQVEKFRSKMEDVYLEACRGDDFFGVQTYTRERFGPDGQLPPEEGVERTLMGYEFWPEALEATIRRATQLTDGVPIVVTENGIGTEDDTRRIEYVTRALEGVHRCLADGIDVRGYFYWSCLDNFEWLFGYRPTFGLIAVDRETQDRTLKPSATWLGDVAKANTLQV